MHTEKAIIIGSGVAGLAAAIRLSVKGYQVTVYETNAEPGGKLSVLEKNGYHFDTGPSLFTQPKNIEELFELAGEPIGDYFNYKPLEVACNYFFENGKSITAFTDRERFASELEEKVAENPAAVKKYLTNAEKLYNNIGTVFIDHSLHKRNTWFHKRIFKALGSTRLKYLFQTLNAYNSKSFRARETKQLFNRFATYNGSNPYKAPAMLSLIPHLEQNEGTFYPKGGMISIIHALYKLALKKGVEFNFNTKVERIIHNEGHAHGVVVNGENIHADIIVSNADVYFTYKHLLNQEPVAKKLMKRERSSSALVFYWGIKKEFAQLGLHNILFSGKYEDEFNYLFRKKQPFSDPTVYINISSKMERAHAPGGKENWFVMINAPSNTGQNWEDFTREARKNIIDKINRILETDIESLIESETILDPIGIEEKTAGFMGSLYGSSSNSKLAAFFRPANFTSYIKGLYFCGGTVHPGGGIPLCLKSAKIVAELVGEVKAVSH